MSNFEVLVSQDQAKEIMGKNMLGLEDVMKHFGVTFSMEQLPQMVEIPFSDAILQEYQDTHVLFPGYPLTILDICKESSQVSFYLRQNIGSEKQGFMEKKVSCRWYLIRKEEVPGSRNKTFEEQKQLLLSDTEIPRACEMAFMIILYQRVTGAYLFPNVYVRCRDIDVSGNHISLGYFSSKGFLVRHWPGFDRHVYLGIAASQKP